MDISFFLLGGAPWINLVNTNHLSNKQVVDDLLHQETALQWLQANNLLRESDLHYLQDEESLRSLVDKLQSFRKLCASFLSDIELHQKITETAIANLKQVVDDINIDLTLIQKEADKPAIIYVGKTTNDHVIYQIAVSILHSLEHVSFDRFRKCEHAECILHFVDTSKSGKRRWCSMELCGNRQKAAEFYSKKKQQRQ